MAIHQKHQIYRDSEFLNKLSIFNYSEEITCACKTNNTRERVWYTVTYLIVWQQFCLCW